MSDWNDRLFSRLGFMTIPNDLSVLASHLAGEYTNRSQALDDPVWYVHLKAWWRPVPLFVEDSIVLFAEQANVLNLDRPYRQRLMRLCVREGQLVGQFYQFAEPNSVLGAGQNAGLLAAISTAEIKELPGCILDVKRLGDRFSGTPRSSDRCSFSYPDGKGGENTGEVELGFEVGPGYFHSYDRGIHPETRKVIWGATLGPYRYTKL